MADVKIFFEGRKSKGYNNIIDSSVFEESITKAFETIPTGEIKAICFDLKNVDFIDFLVIINMSAFCQSIRHDNPACIFKFIWPDSQSVFTFLKIWNFKDAIENAINLDPSKDLENGRKSFLQKESTEEDVYKIVNATFPNTLINNKVKDLILYQKFFSVLSFKLDSSVPSSTNENSRRVEYSLEDSNSLKILPNYQVLEDILHDWREQGIKEVLENVFKDADGNHLDDYVPNKVIFELITNALRHPNGTLLQTSSFFQSKEKNTHITSDHFKIAVWDNGKSMIEVLRDAYIDTKNITTSVPNEIRFPIFHLNLHEPNKKLNDDRLKVDSRIVPNEGFLSKIGYWNYDYYWLLSTFFPGVTSDPKGKSITLREDTRAKYRNRGMGLYVLLHTVVNIFNGKIVVRTGRYNMVIKQNSSKANNYDVDIKRRPECLPLFSGNLIAVHLPLKY